MTVNLRVKGLCVWNVLTKIFDLEFTFDNAVLYSFIFHNLNQVLYAMRTLNRVANGVECLVLDLELSKIICTWYFQTRM